MAVVRAGWVSDSVTRQYSKINLLKAGFRISTQLIRACLIVTAPAVFLPTNKQAMCGDKRVAWLYKYCLKITTINVWQKMICKKFNLAENDIK